MERGKESVVISDFCVRFTNPWRRHQSTKNVAIEKLFHLDFELFAQGAPIPIIFGVNEQRRYQIYVLNVQPTPRADQEISSSTSEREFWLADPLLVPPSEVSIEIAVGIIENKPNSTRVNEMRRKCSSEVRLGVATKSIRAEIKADSKQGGRPHTEARRRT